MNNFNNTKKSIGPTDFAKFINIIKQKEDSLN